MTPELLSLLLGFIQPFVVEVFKALLNASKWPRWAAFAFAGLFSILIGFVTTAAFGKLDWSNFFASTAYALTAAQSLYNVWFKPAALDTKITTLVNPPPAQ
jgi:hypothetical protein